MSVLVEAISVIARIDSIEAHFPGGLLGYERACPNDTFCCDGYVARVGFMHPDDVQAFAQMLESHGLRYVHDGRACDFLVVDQQQGSMVSCDWLDVGRATGGGNTVTACRMRGMPDVELAHPEGWTYEGSLSQTFSFVSFEGMNKSMTFLRHEDGEDVYLSDLTGGEARIARAKIDK